MKITAIIESPKGTPQKFTHDRERDEFELSKIMPAGMVFPYDFGYIPDTKGEDGDPLDVIVISEFGTFPGCRIKCRLIGCIQALQTEHDGKQEQNDRYLAIPEADNTCKNIETYKDLPADLLEQLEYFFVHYNSLANKKFEPLGICGPEKSARKIKEAGSEVKSEK